MNRLPGFSREISVTAEMSPEINIDVEFNLTDKEMRYQKSLVFGVKGWRKQEIERLYLVQKHTLQEVGKILNISKSQVQREAEEIRDEILGTIKKDLRRNKKVLNQMSELLAQVDHQARMIWNKMNKLDEEVEVLRRVLSEADRRVSSDESLAVDFEEVNDSFEKLMQTHDRQQKYLNLLRQQTLAKLEILERFGLTGNDALEIIMKGGVDVDLTIQKFRILMVKLIEIVKFEVADDRIRRNIFGRLAREVKIESLKQDDL